MSAFMVTNHLMQKVMTAILQNTDEFATTQTFRGHLVDDPPTDAQCKAAEDIGKRLFSINATPVEQFKAMRCLLYQSCEGTVPNGRLYGELNQVAGELAQRIVQDSPDYEQAPWG
jgi:hypothetical protein